MGLDGRQGWRAQDFAGPHVELGAVADARKLVAIEVAFMERAGIMGAAVIEGEVFAVDVGDYELPRADPDLMERARLDLCGLSDHNELLQGRPSWFRSVVSRF
jgi:hypothetical protein